MMLRPTTADNTTWMQQVFRSLNIPWQENVLGFIAEEGISFPESPRSKGDSRKVGLITYSIDIPDVQAQNTSGVYKPVCHIISLNSLTPGKGIGKALLEKVEEVAREKNCTMIIANSSEITNEFFLKNGFSFSLKNHSELQKAI